MKSCYRHYLCSHRAQHEVENATNITANLEMLKRELRVLYTRLYELQAMRPAPISTGLKVVREPVSQLRHDAIMHFRSDRRFKYNE